MPLPFPTLLPWIALCLAAALLWPAATRRYALVPLGAGYAWGWAQGALDPIVLLWLALLLATGWAARAPGPSWRRATGHALFVALAAGLGLHLLPGFHNAQAIAAARYTADAAPFSMYLNLDKPLVAFWVVLAAAPPMAGADAAATLRAALAACAAAAVACLGVALAVGLVGWAPKWPAQGWLWLANNALLVTLAEEALFRGYVQQQLTARWGHHRGGAALAIGAAALLFGLAHLAGGVQWVALASLAGVAYGVAYRYGGLAAAVLAHLGLNTLHFACFTYPMRMVAG
jgi:membrane protease YdiL (CAAX protease family)